MKIRLLIVSLAVLSIAGLSYGNLLLNPGFEIGPAAGATPDNWWAVGALGQEDWADETGTNGVGFQAWTAGNWGYMGQDVTVASAASSEFTYTIRALAEANYNSTGNETYMKLELWNAGGTIQYGVITNDIHSAMIGDRDNWNTYTIGYTNTDPNVELVKPVFGYGQAQDDLTGNQGAWVDNTSFTQVIPEPSSLALLVLGMLGFYGVRRRRS